MDDTVSWLMSPDVPPVRYLTARDLLGYDQPTLARMKLEIPTWPPLKSILDLQQPDGGFPNRTRTRTGGPTLAALGIMARCGLSLEDECVARAFRYVESTRLHEGVFTVRGKGSGVLPCYAGMFTRLVGTLAGTSHPWFQAGLSWIVRYQRFDHKKSRGGGPGTWPYKSVINYGGCWNSVSCFHGVGPTLRALSLVPPAARTREVGDRIASALNYLRIHRVYQKSGSDTPLFRNSTKLFLFGAYRSNLLDTVEGIAEAQPDVGSAPWVADALRAIETAAHGGRVVSSRSYDSELIDPLPLESPGESRFLTYQWLITRGKLGLS